MHRSLGYVTLLVRAYDEAIAYYTEKLSFTLMEDQVLSETKRWVLVAPGSGTGTSLLLAKASTPEQEQAIGAQCAGRVAFFLHTDNFLQDYQRMCARGVAFLESPRNETYGRVAVFRDLYGNRWDLLELKTAGSLLGRVIRLAETSDAIAVADVFLRSRKHALSFAPLVHSDEEVGNWVRDTLIARTPVFVAQVDSTICAMMAISVRSNQGWIDHLYVHPGHMGRGHGSALLSLAKRVLPSPIKLYTFQQNGGARLFYEREGFVALELTDGATNEEHCPDVLYQWRREGGL